MTTYKFIFSERRITKFKRHIVFWMVYGMSFYLYNLSPRVASVSGNSNYIYLAWVNVYCFLPACIVSVYIFLYFPLPHYPQKKEYIKFLAAVFLLYAILNFTNYYLALLFFTNTCRCDAGKLNQFYIFSYGNNYAFLAVATGFFAAGIKFTKIWYTKHREILELENQQANAELQTLKTNIRSDFLFQSLPTLEENIKSCSLESPEIVLKFSEILSFMLYDCDEEYVPLQEELNTIEKYLFLQKIKMKNSLVINLDKQGSNGSQLIVPCLLLSFLQNCFMQFYQEQTERIMVKVETKVSASQIELLFLVILMDHGQTLLFNRKEIISRTQQQLYKFYPDNHELRIKEEKEQILITLTLNLDKTTRPVILLPVTQTNQEIYETV